MPNKRRSKNKRKQRSNKAVVAPTTGQLRPFVAANLSMQRTGGRPRQRRLRQVRNLSEPGLSFLKCAFAAPDFAVDPGKGIPDRFHGRTLSLKDCNTTAISFVANQDTYIIVAPVPGFAYFIAQTSIGGDPSTLQFLGVPFPTYGTNFGDGTTISNKFSKFRYASMAVGLYPTSNMMQFSGSIQVWRIDLNLAENLRTLTGTSEIAESSSVCKRIQGLQGVVSLAPRDNYSESFIKGLYTYAFDKSEDFEWQDFISGTYYQETDGLSGGTGRALYSSGINLTGLGNVNSIVIKVSTPTAAVNTGLLRVWNCIELQPDTNSSLFQFSGVSPALDQNALDLYSAIKMRFPVAMPCDQNSKFWERVLNIIRQVSAAGSNLPGNVGLLSGGINSIATGLSNLIL